MILLILFAFLGGVVTILSPCILPILPIVLSSSSGGKRKPLGVVTGFVLSFTFFTLFLTSIVRATGIPADSLRFVSIIVIAGFGLSFLIPQFQLLVERLFSKLSSLIPQRQNLKEDFASGFVIGLSVGLLWTPCVGPILASVISLALTGSVTGTAFVITLAYSLGTAIPMFGVMYGGRELLTRNPWLVRNTANIQKGFGVLMIITAVGIYFNIDRQFQAYILTRFPQYGAGLTKFEDNESIKKQLEDMNKKPKKKSLLPILNEDYGLAPEIIEGGKWFNLPADKQSLKIADLRGKVVLIDFWTYTCINCIRTLPYLRAWHEKYKDRGLVIIGVHTPEFEFEKNPENVQKAIQDFGLKYPVIQDNDYATWRAYDNRYWPAKYLIDKDGRIRYTHFGEGEYDTTEKKIQELLAEAGRKIEEETTKIQDETPRGMQTPETYLGSLRMERKSDNPEGLPLHYFSLDGDWKVAQEYSESGKKSSLTLHYYGAKVFLVMNPANGNGKVKVYLDGKLINTITLDKDRLYDLVKLKEKGDHILKLEFLNEGIKIFAFTFG